MRQMQMSTPSAIFFVAMINTINYYLDEDVFVASALCFFIVSFKRYYDNYLLWFFLHFSLKFKPFDEFFSFQNVIPALSLCVAISIEWQTSLKLSLALFLVPFLNIVGWVALEVSLRFMLKFKPFKMWRPVSLFILLRFLLWVWKVIFTRTVRKALNAIWDKNKT